MKKNKRTPARVLTGGNIARGATALSVTGLMAMMSPAHEAVAADNPFVQQFGQGNNPLYAPIGGDHCDKPALVDINNDGLVDLFIGNDDGTISYFENTGTAAQPVFVPRLDADNPFDGVDVGNYAAPTFADVDDDGLIDAVVGADDGYLDYFHNTGTAADPQFTEQTGADNPFNGLRVTVYSGNVTPHFADVNNDGAVDLVVGDADGYLHYVENNGDGTFDFYNYYDDSNPFQNVDVGYDSAPAHLDSNNNGQVDPGEAIVVGTRYNYFEYFQKEEDGSFTHYEEDDTDNPLYDVDGGYRNAPAFADLDDDGDMDMTVGNDDDEPLLYFANINTDADPVFKQRTGADSPFYGFDVGNGSQPVFVDIDGDGDLDVFSVAEDGDGYMLSAAKAPADSESGLKFFENTGTPTEPRFVERTGAGNPLDGITPTGVEEDGQLAFVAFADIDGDGDMDAFVGSTGWSYSYSYSPIGPTYTYERTGSITFYENTGNAKNPIFEQRGDADNPLFFVEEPNDGFAFVDIDGDGDLDAFGGGTNYSMTYSDGGEHDGRETFTVEGDINFYENKGSGKDPAFAPGEANPLGFVFGSSDAVYSGCYSLAFGDIDGDGDLDAVVGERTMEYSKYSDPNTLALYENVGSKGDPAFAPVAEANDTFAKLNEEANYKYLTPAFVDIDGDGDLDIFSGEKYGRFLFFRNTTSTPAAGGGLSGGDGDSNSDAIGCFIETAGTRATAGGHWRTQAA